VHGLIRSALAVLCGCMIAGRASAGREDATPISPLPIANSSLRFLEHCDLRVVSFRTREQGLVIDACANLFRTEDAGLTWIFEERSAMELITGARAGNPRGPVREQPHEGESVAFIAWTTPREALAGTTHGGRLFRTGDGGDTWTESSTPPTRTVIAIAARGDTRWACGAGGELLRSIDAGTTWSLLLPSFRVVDPCVSLQLDSQQHLRAKTAKGWHWQSNDDGETWIAGARGTAATTEQLRTVSAWGSGTVEILGDRLRFATPHMTMSTQPLLTSAGGKPEPLLFAERRGANAIGLSSRHFFLFEADRWYVRSDLPPGLARRVTPLSPDLHVLVLEIEDSVYRSENFGRTWEPSRHAGFDLAAVATIRRPRETASAGAPSEAALACLTEGRVSHLRIELGHRGCFGGSEEDLELIVENGEATVEVLSGRLHELLHPVPRLSKSAFLALTHKLGAAISRPALESGGQSTTMTSAAVSWICAGENRENTVMERTNEWNRGDPEVYAPALAITDITLAAVDANPNNEQ
jgi:hypothetical protein